MWDVEETYDRGDYVMAKLPNHPAANDCGYILLHRVIVENNIGRLLTAEEVVHHINHDRKDNRIENLQVMTQSEHASLHSKKSKLVELRCPMCGCVFIRRRAQSCLGRQRSSSSCSRSCGIRFAACIKYGLLSKTDIEERINSNVIREYEEYAYLALSHYHH